MSRWPRAWMPHWLALMGKRRDNPGTQHKQTSLGSLVPCSQPPALLSPAELAPEVNPVTCATRQSHSTKDESCECAVGSWTPIYNDLLRAALLSLPVRENETNGIWKWSPGWLGKSDTKVAFLIMPVCSVIGRTARGQCIEDFSGSGTALLTSTYTEITWISYLTDQL